MDIPPEQSGSLASASEKEVSTFEHKSKVVDLKESVNASGVNLSQFKESQLIELN